MAETAQSLWLYNVLFQIHFWIGAMAGLYIALMSVTGSIIVYRDELSQWTSVQWIVKLHTNLLLDRPPACERHRRRLFDAAMSDRSHHMVAGSEELAPQS